MAETLCLRCRNAPSTVFNHVQYLGSLSSHLRANATKIGMRIN